MALITPAAESAVIEPESSAGITPLTVAATVVKTSADAPRATNPG
ncbi:MAG: hypothetical protein WD767_00295 [Alphaproteobacteria bacterium]